MSDFSFDPDFTLDSDTPPQSPQHSSQASPETPTEPGDAQSSPISSGVPSPTLSFKLPNFFPDDDAMADLPGGPGTPEDQDQPAFHSTNDFSGQDSQTGQYQGQMSDDPPSPHLNHSSTLDYEEEEDLNASQYNNDHNFPETNSLADSFNQSLSSFHPQHSSLHQSVSANDSNDFSLVTPVASSTERSNSQSFEHIDQLDSRSNDLQYSHGSGGERDMQSHKSVIIIPLAPTSPLPDQYSPDQTLHNHNIYSSIDGDSCNNQSGHNQHQNQSSKKTNKKRDQKSKIPKNQPKDHSATFAPSPSFDSTPQIDQSQQHQLFQSTTLSKQVISNHYYSPQQSPQIHPNVVETHHSSTILHSSSTSNPPHTLPSLDALTLHANPHPTEIDSNGHNPAKSTAQSHATATSTNPASTNSTEYDLLSIHPQQTADHISYRGNEHNADHIDVSFATNTQISPQLTPDQQPHPFLHTHQHHQHHHHQQTLNQPCVDQMSDPGVLHQSHGDDSYEPSMYDSFNRSIAPSIFAANNNANNPFSKSTLPDHLVGDSSETNLVNSQDQQYSNILQNDSAEASTFRTAKDSPQRDPHSTGNRQQSATSLATAMSTHTPSTQQTLTPSKRFKFVPKGKNNQNNNNTAGNVNNHMNDGNYNDNLLENDPEIHAVEQSLSSSTSSMPPTRSSLPAAIASTPNTGGELHAHPQHLQPHNRRSELPHNNRANNNNITTTVLDGSSDPQEQYDDAVMYEPLYTNMQHQRHKSPQTPQKEQNDRDLMLQNSSTAQAAAKPSTRKAVRYTFAKKGDGGNGHPNGHANRNGKGEADDDQNGGKNDEIGQTNARPDQTRQNDHSIDLTFNLDAADGDSEQTNTQVAQVSSTQLPNHQSPPRNSPQPRFIKDITSPMKTPQLISYPGEPDDLMQTPGSVATSARSSADTFVSAVNYSNSDHSSYSVIALEQKSVSDLMKDGSDAYGDEFVGQLLQTPQIIDTPQLYQQMDVIANNNSQHRANTISPQTAHPGDDNNSNEFTTPGKAKTNKNNTTSQSEQIQPTTPLHSPQPPLFTPQISPHNNTPQTPQTTQSPAVRPDQHHVCPHQQPIATLQLDPNYKPYSPIPLGQSATALASQQQSSSPPFSPFKPQSPQLRLTQSSPHPFDQGGDSHHDISNTIPIPKLDSSSASTSIDILEQQPDLSVSQKLTPGTNKDNNTVTITGPKPTPHSPSFDGISVSSSGSITVDGSLDNQRSQATFLDVLYGSVKPWILPALISVSVVAATAFSYYRFASASTQNEHNRRGGVSQNDRNNNRNSEDRDDYDRDPRPNNNNNNNNNNKNNNVRRGSF